MTTNQNNKKKNTAARKLIPAIGMLTVSAMMLSSSTYAWFTMNKEVEVTGMELRTKVGANLFISDSNVEADYSPEDLLEARMGLLEPVSSINGTTGSFYYTVNANADGQKQSGATITNYTEAQNIANTVAGKVKYDVTFNSTYGIKDSGTLFTTDDIKMSGTTQDGAAYGYIDYVFYLKATAESANQKLNMTECNLLYNGAAIAESGASLGSGTATQGKTLDRAWRAAVFAQDITDKGGKGYSEVSSIDPAANGQGNKGLLALKDAAYFTASKAQTSSGLGDVSNFKNITGVSEGVVLDTITAQGETRYYKVLIRVWLEGEDNTCNSETYARLQNNWKFNCKFELGNDEQAVKGINSDTNKVQVGTTEEATNTNDVNN